MWSVILLFTLSILYAYRVQLGQALLPLIMPYVLEYLTKNPKTLVVSEQEVGEAEVVGRLVKIPFRFNGQKYTYWTSYNRRAKSGTKFYANRDGHREDLEWCPWLPLSITTIELKASTIDVEVPNEKDDI